MSEKQVPRKNAHIWQNWSALPRLKVMVDNGFSNKDIVRYLVNRYGWREGDNLRSLEFQVSHYKRNTKDFWKIYKMRKEGVIADYTLAKSDFILSKPARKTQEYQQARRRVQEKVKRSQKFKMEDFSLGEFETLPPGYYLKWTWNYNFYGASADLMACPPIGTSPEEKKEEELLQECH